MMLLACRLPSLTMIKPLLFLFSLPWIALAAADEKPNILLLCIDDLRPELNCYGKSYIHSPHIDALAARGHGTADHLPCSHGHLKGRFRFLVHFPILIRNLASRGTLPRIVLR